MALLKAERDTIEKPSKSGGTNGMAGYSAIENRQKYIISKRMRQWNEHVFEN